MSFSQRRDSDVWQWKQCVVQPLLGVAIDTDTGSVVHFGSMVPKTIVDEWKSGGIQQVITQAEVYPVLLAKLEFGQDWVGRRVISFIDNDAARWAVVKSYTTSLEGAALVDKYWQSSMGTLKERQMGTRRHPLPQAHQ